MKISDLFSMLGGLALFLYGMQMMSNGLEEAAGNRMKQILQKLTANRFLGVAVGAGITAVIQSSSATTVMVVGFVNSGMMTLSQAVWIIMGANIGTTVTGLLIALDIGLLAPLIAFLGVAALVFLKNPKIQHIGKIAAGLGVLFIGMDMMSAAMKPLQNSEAFVSLMTQFSNPLLGILAGALFTAVIQSSSASVGILQTLARNGLILFPNAVFVLFGQNIGTCITAVLASIGTSRAAKRTTIIHLMFNIIGTIIFTTLCILFPITDLVAVTSADPAGQIANMHLIFNIVTTCLLLPFGNLLAALAARILPEPPAEDIPQNTVTQLSAIQLGHTMLGYSAIHLEALANELEQMITLAQENVQRCFRAVILTDTEAMNQAVEAEETIDLFNKEISQYISKFLALNRSDADIAPIEEYFLISGNVERIGDHAMNIGGYVKRIIRKEIQFSPAALNELSQMEAIVMKSLEKIIHRDSEMSQWLSQIAALEQRIDDMTKQFRSNHIVRMRQGICSEEGAVLYVELLTDFERIGDHILNIAQSYAKIEG